MGLLRGLISGHLGGIGTMAMQLTHYADKASAFSTATVMETLGEAQDTFPTCAFRLVSGEGGVGFFVIQAFDVMWGGDPSYITE